MSNIVVPVLSVTIGLFFVLVGTIKLTPFLSEEFYKEMVVLSRLNGVHSACVPSTAQDTTAEWLGGVAEQ